MLQAEKGPRSGSASGLSTSSPHLGYADFARDHLARGMFKCSQHYPSRRYLESGDALTNWISHITYGCQALNSTHGYLASSESSEPFEVQTLVLTLTAAFRRWLNRIYTRIKI